MHYTSLGMSHFWEEVRQLYSRYDPIVRFALKIIIIIPYLLSKNMNL